MELKTGYKQTEIGVIPSDWEVKEIGNEIDLLTGFPFPSSKYSIVGIRLLRGSNIKRGVTDWAEEITQYWERITPALKEYILHEKDIVIAMDGSLVGRSFAQLSSNDLPALLLQRVARVRSKKIDIGYLKEFICSEYFTKHCDAVKTSSAIPHISPLDIRKFKIPLPPTLAEQTAIATALSDTDQYITHLEKLIAKKRNIKQGAMQELLRPKEGWVVKKLGEIGTVIRGASPRPQGDTRYYGGTVPRLMVEDVTRDGKFVTPKVDFLTEEGAKRSRPCKAGTLTIVCSGTVGIPSILAVDACIHDGFLALVKIKKEYSSDYLYHQLIVLREKFEQSATHGGVFTNLTTSILKEFEITFPSENEQTRIATILSDMDSEIATVEAKLSKAQSIKQGMMQQLLTGKIRLI